MIKHILLLVALFVSISLFSQNQIKFTVSDSANDQPVFGAKVVLKGTNNGAITDSEGNAVLTGIINGTHVVLISSIGYTLQELDIKLPDDNNKVISISLVSEVEEMEEVIVEATRANRSISNLPTRTEALTEEIDEAASMEPSKIAHLITHSTGIQVQTTTATSNGAVVRIQGLNGRYTQMLMDGFPLFGGFSGSLDILQIPPLDLRQVEYIKGSASTLYGGGAIGGLVNLLTKTPKRNETLLHLNMSHIGARDFNAFASRRFGKFGFTNLASMHLHSPYDADNDGYSDVPEVSKFNFNPKLFFYPDKKTELYLGANIMIDDRAGGDMRLINEYHADTLHYYIDRQKSKRYTSQFSAKRDLNENNSVTFKNSVSLYDRNISINTDANGGQSEFSGKQLNSFTELNYSLNNQKNNLSIGLNHYYYDFAEQNLDTSQLRDQYSSTYGAYINHLWDIRKKFSTELGFRGDYSVAGSEVSKSSGDFFALPRLSMLYKINRSFSLRLGGGIGYRMPSLFSEEAEPYGYQGVQAVDFATINAEKSYGGNFDFKYQTTFGSENLLLTFNHMFYYNLIDNPILLSSDSTGYLTYKNGAGPLTTRGFESQIKLTVYWFTWFFGYTYTDAFLENFGSDQRLILTPKHSIKGDLLFVVDEKWRIGWDYEYKSEQLLSTGIQSRSLFTTGIVVERTLGNFVIFLNAENFTDVRQTKYESILSGPNNTPQFTDIYAPLDGFFFNAGLKIKLD